MLNSFPLPTRSCVQRRSSLSCKLHAADVRGAAARWALHWQGASMHRSRRSTRCYAVEQQVFSKFASQAYLDKAAQRFRVGEVPLSR